MKNYYSKLQRSFTSHLMMMTVFSVELVIKQPVLRVDVVQHPLGVHGGGGREQDQLKLARGVATKYYS